MKSIMKSLRPKVSKLLLSSVILLGSLTACEKEPVSLLDPSPEQTNNEIEQLLGNAGELEEVVPKEDITTSVFEENRNGITFSCTQTEVDATIAPEKFHNYDPNADVIVAGILLQGGSLSKGTPDRVPVRRGGGQLTISTLNGSEQVTGSMEEFSVGNYFETVNKLLRENSGIVPAKFNFTIQQIQAEEELELALQAESSSLKLIKASLSFSTDIEKKFNRIVVLLNQSYYSILFDRPNTVSDFFHPNVSVEELRPHFGPQNPLTYISSVNVGRQFALLIESTESSSVIEAAANACFSGNCGGGSTKILSELKDLRVKAFALGGEAGQLIQAVTSNINELADFLATSGDIRTGVPLSYVVRTILEDKIIKNGVSTQYTLENCVPLVAPACDCQFKGEGCDIPKKIQNINTRTVSKGSGGVDASVRTTNADEVVVGMKITVSNELGIRKNRVRILRIIVRKVNPDGTLGPKRVIKSPQANDNGGAEIEFEAPGNGILTGVGLRVSDTNVNRARFHHAELFRDDADCRFKLREQRAAVLGDGGGLEQEYKLSDEYDFNKVTPVIKGLSVGAHADNINVLKIEVGELVMN